MAADEAWLDDWHRSRKNPDNVCRYIKGVGLVTVFLCGDGTFKFAHGGTFSKPYPTQKDAQLAAKDCEVSAPAQRASAQERNTMATEATAAQQHPSKAQFDRLVAYVQELVADHNRLEARVEALEAARQHLEGEQAILERVRELEHHEGMRQRIENEKVERQAKKLREKNGFAGRNAELEAEAGA